MPFKVSTSTPARRMAVTPMTTGGFARAERPDLNDPVDVYRRAVGEGFVGGQHGSTQLPTHSGATFVAPSGESALSQNLALEQRGVTRTLESELADRQRNMFAPIRTVPLDRKWAALHQALFEAGTDKIQTGARAGMGPRGFFDTQATMSPQAQQRLELLKAVELNEGREDQAAQIEAMIRQGMGG